MNNTRIPFDSFAYNSNPNLNPVMKERFIQLDSFRRSQAPINPRQGSNYIPTIKNPSTGEASRTVIFIVLGFLIVAIVIWIIVNFLLYKDDKAWFKVYKAPPPPSNSVQPNGDGTGGQLDDSVNTFKNQNLTGYSAKNPSTTPSEFGGYISVP